MQMVSVLQLILAASFLLQGFFSSKGVVVNAKRYELPAGWTISNDASLGGFEGRGVRVLNASATEQIVSDNGRFGLAFYDPHGTGDFYLSVLLNVQQPSKAVSIWAANFNSSVSNGANLMLTKSHRKFILLDSNSGGSLKWSSGPAAGITAVDLQESGNLVFYNQSEVVWESFRQPLDVLVPGQKLTTGMSIISIHSNKNSMQPRQFKGTMEASGFVLYVLPQSEATMANMLRQPQPYLVWSINHQRPSILESAKTDCGAQQAVMNFTGNTVKISYSSGAACGGPLVVDVEEAKGETLRYLKLQEDGNLVVFEFDNKIQSWNAVYHALDGKEGLCKLPSSCGSYGVCTSSSSSGGEQACRCIGDTKLEDLPKGSSVCRPPGGVSTSCLSNEAQNHHLVEIPGATYFSNAFLQPDMIKASIDNCVSLCTSNCSCGAAFYNQSSGSCFLVDELMGSLSNAPEYSTAYIKIQNSKLVTSSSNSIESGGTSKSARVAIILLAVMCVGLAVTLVAVILIVKTKYPHAYNKLMRR